MIPCVGISKSQNLPRSPRIKNLMQPIGNYRKQYQSPLLPVLGLGVIHFLVM